MIYFKLKKAPILPIFLILISSLFTGCISQEELGICEFPSDLEGYNLVWSDEFEGTEVDQSKWTFLIGDGCDISENLCGWGNNELQWYTDRKENAFISDGNLVIQARKETPQFNGKSYTSARMVTKEKGDWQYARIDVRAKMPRGKGLWPAIWMLPTDEVYGGWPKSGEIDIMEYLGDKTNEVLGTIHFGHDYWRFISGKYELESGQFYQDFHVFSLQWKESCIQFFVDGEQIGESLTPSSTLPTTWPFQERFHMILNVAVGGNLPGNPDASTQFPQKMTVDYVRVYQEI
ncbi:UNVERIFIED_CONTAM: hypothetical protein GTU68_014857 [Idotea baltica]|nr:hypothetical protein [Idotea baltica]